MKDEELSGHWWLPASPERRAAGTLTVRGNQPPELQLHEPLSDQPWDSPTTVWGLSDQAEPVTVDVEFEIGRSRRWRHPGLSVVQQHLAVRTALVGAHLDSPPRSFRRVTVEFSGLLEWTGWRLLEEDWDGESSVLKYTHREPLNAVAEDLTISLAAGHGTSGDGVATRTFEVGAWFNVERLDGWDIGDWLKYAVAPLQSFVSILSDRPVGVDTLQVEMDDDEYGRVLYAPVDVEVPTERASSFEIPFSAESISQRFDEIVVRWLALDSQLGPALDLYLSAQNRPSAHLENRFLNLAAAAEAYHRRMTPPAPEREIEHQKRMKRVLAVVEARRDRDWLAWKLKYASEPSFADRLEQLAQRSELVLRPWLGDSKEFARRISDARNLLVHRDPGSPNPEPDGRSILDMLEDLAILLLVCLYQDLGFDSDEISKALRRGRRWRLMEFRKREWN